MRRVRFVAVAALLALAACGNPELPPAQHYATITGRVYDADTNEPVAGAVITGSTVLNATSSSDGTYKIANFPIGPNELQVTAPAGYRAVAPQVSIAPQQGETLTVNVALKKAH